MSRRLSEAVRGLAARDASAAMSAIAELALAPLRRYLTRVLHDSLRRRAVALVRLHRHGDPPP